MHIMQRYDGLVREQNNALKIIQKYLHCLYMKRGALPEGSTIGLHRVKNLERIVLSKHFKMFNSNPSRYNHTVSMPAA